MSANAALAATMVRMPPTSTVLRAFMDCLARALMGVLSAACTSIVVDVSAGSWLRSITCRPWVEGVHRHQNSYL